MALWNVEIASEPELIASGPGLPDAVLVGVGAAIEDFLDRGELIEGAGSGSADGRVGGEWVVEAATADEAEIKARSLLSRALEVAGVPAEDSRVDYVRVEFAE